MRSPHFSDDSDHERPSPEPEQRQAPDRDRDYRQRDSNSGSNLDSKARDRNRSRSPPRQSSATSAAPSSQRPKQDFSKGFKWKSKGSTREEKKIDFRDKYRDRDPEYQPRRYGGRSDGERIAERNRDREDRDRDRDYERDRDRRRDRDRGGRENSYHDDSYRRGRDRRDDYDDRRRDDRRRDDRPPRRDADRQPAALAHPPAGGAGQNFIVVTVNDRLGTKARIPCLPSDTVGNFKKLVAAQIGRQPHEIMLKRQSQRPFKDALTLEDYEVGNGVQLDLELDTGD